MWFHPTTKNYEEEMWEETRRVSSISNGVFHYGVRWVCSFVVLFHFVPGGVNFFIFFIF